MRRRLFVFIVAVCLLAAICPQFGLIASASATTDFPVDVLLDYGNGTRTWSTNILSTPGHDSAFNATQVAAGTLNYTVSPYGVFVDAINGVWNNWTSGYWWSLFFWNFTSGSWQSSSVGADQLVLIDGDMIAWFYDLHPWPPLPPEDPPVTHVEVMLNYGNGNVTWNMVFLIGACNSFKATKAAADTVNYTTYSSGVFVDAINGVWNNWTSGYWWSLFFWNFTSGSWQSSSVGADQLVLIDGDMIAWVYDIHSWPQVPPIPSDVNGDGIVNILDILIGASAFGSETGDPSWNRGVDLKRDGIINILDLVLIAVHFGETW